MQNGDRPSIESAFLLGLVTINLQNLAGISQSIPFLFGWTFDAPMPETRAASGLQPSDATRSPAPI